MRFKLLITIIFSILFSNACDTIKKKSQYKAVYFQKRDQKWYVLIHTGVKGQRRKYGGTFNNELDAAKKVNQLCEELDIPQQNPDVGAILNTQLQAKNKISEYKGVFFHKGNCKWQVLVPIKGQKIYGGSFNDELNAAKKS
jgi:hypothetical protein